jgi:D-arabinose 1-dehydrogenase-like Zn-dependent alcohol dehydrogenase
VIEAIGPGVERLRPGDRVGVRWIQRTCGACPACARGAETRCPSPITWIENGGGLSELVVAEASGCTTIPETLAFEQAAPLFCAGHVAMSALRRANPAPGERVAVLGLGALGHLAVQIARAEGHEVVAVTSSEEKARDARDLGAHEAIVSTDDPGEALASLGGADVILATTSSMTDIAMMVSGLHEGGRLVVVGLGDGGSPSIRQSSSSARRHSSAPSKVRWRSSSACSIWRPAASSFRARRRFRSTW